MASLFGIIAQYQSKLIMLPLMIVLFTAVTVALYMLFHSVKWMKYLPALVGVVLGIGFFVLGFARKAHIAGLQALWAGVYFFVAGCIALAAARLLTLVESLTPPEEKGSNTVKGKKN